ncbi:MAG: hypothetical protein SVW02_00065 [Candidatus Nanohaloarchaea archaeon]|nr:hypothetical protein [Candidatus Nanohaloarchaea archaeon]
MNLRGSADVREVLAVAALSIVAILPLFVVDVGIGKILEGEAIAMLTSLVPLLLLLPLPAAYVATISRHRFRPETLGALATLPLGLLGAKFAAFAVGLVLGLLLVSYKSRSIYTGDNQFWTFFTASAALVTVLALVLGVSAAHTYSASADVRQGVQDNVTEFTVNTATEFIDLAQQGATPQQITGAAVALAENMSRTSIAMTEKAVFRAVEENGTFSDTEKQLLRTAFTQSKQRIPSQLSTRARQQVEERLGGQREVENELIRSRTAPIIQKLTSPTLPLLIAVFFTLVSLVYIFKIPVSIIGGVYGMIILRLRKRFGEEQPRQRQPAERRQRR